ncbi:MAG: CoA transferase [Clostridiales bacterium]|nr:CoA transferase [Clostridiales bacterium]
MSGTAPLSRIKVLDFTAFEAGTVCTETLAWLGAEVWKVERPKLGEIARYSVAEPGKDTVGFCILNMNKHSITCNLKSAEGRELMLEAIQKVDVMVENMGPGSIEKNGLSYDTVHALNPRLVYTQIKGFHMQGPGRDYPAFNPIAAAMGGLTAVNGPAGGAPMQCGVNVADSGAGVMAALTVMAALMQREKTGCGQRLEIDIQDVVIGLGRSNWEPFYRTGKPPRRVGSGMPLEDVAPCDLYPCKPFGINDYVHIYCSRHPGSKNFESLCKVMGREDLLSDERFATPRSRFQHRDILDPIISDWTGKHTKQEAMDILCKADIPAGAILDCQDITDDPHLRETGTMVEMPYDGKKLVVPGFAPKMSDYQVDYAAAPALGEYNETVYRTILGKTEEEFEELKKNGVI